MSIVIVDLNTNEISIDKVLFPDSQSDDLIYEHLLYYFSKLNHLPTIEVIIHSNSPVVVRGHIYLTIAKELKFPKIRALINPSSPKVLVKNFFKEHSIEELDWNTIREEEDNVLVGFFWYIFFFEKPLDSKIRKVFEEEVIEFFRAIGLPEWAEIPNNRIKDLNYPFLGKCAEFQAYVPIADERWYAASREIIVNFHRKYVSIISFQGRKLQIE